MKNEDFINHQSSIISHSHIIVIIAIIIATNPTLRIRARYTVLMAIWRYFFAKIA